MIIKLHDFFYLLSMMLFSFYNSGHEFERLIRVNSSCFFNRFFNFNYILQHYVCWGLSFIIYFNLFSIKLSKSHDPGRGFDKLNQIDKLPERICRFRESTCLYTAEAIYH